MLMSRRVFSIYPTYSVEYNIPDPSERSTWERKAPPKRTGTRIMSKESRKELMNAISWLTLFSPLHKVFDKESKTWKTFKVNFITLTLAQEQMHPDAWIKKHMLEPFLKWMAR